jgi:hypothetical protein
MIYSSICKHCFVSLKPLNKWRKDFIKDVLWLILSIHGKINFLQLSCYGKFGEQHYRRQFEKDFDFLGFNTSLVKENTVERGKSLHMTPVIFPSRVNIHHEEDTFGRGVPVEVSVDWELAK